MHYEIYIDSLIFTNLVMNLFLLFLVNASTFRTATPGRLLAGATVGAVGVVLPFWGGGISVYWFGMGALLGTVGMLLVAFPIRSIRMFLKLFEKLLIYSFILGGGMLFLIKVFEPFRRYFTATVGILGMGSLLYAFVRGTGVGEPSGCYCQVTLIKSGEKIILNAFVDSGNSLVEPISKKPVCIVDGDALKESNILEMKCFRAIPYHSVGKNGLLPGYLLPLMRVQKDGMIYEFRDVYIAVSANGIFKKECTGEESVKMIMNPALFGEREPRGRQIERENDSESGNAGCDANQSSPQGEFVFAEKGRNSLYRRGGSFAAAFGIGKRKSDNQ